MPAPIDRRHFLQGAAALAPASLQAQTATGKRPNVVILLADDLGFKDVGYQGSEIQTPRIDALSRAGLRFNQFHAMPLCSPTRASLLTARHPVRYALTYSVVRPWSNYGLSPQEQTMADLFRAAGYQTAMTGKWHLGHYHTKLLPRSRGFDHFYGHLNGAIDYFTHLRDGAPDWQRNGVTVKEEGYTTDLLAAEASRWIRARDRNRPFFLYVPWNAPHAPLMAPPDLIEKYSAIKQPRRRTYAAMVAALDRGIGQVLDTLQQEGVADDTIVMFLSDNGGPRGQGADNGELRAGKATVFGGGVRVPAVLHWPGKIKPGSTEQVMSVLDLLPTLTAAAGVPSATKLPLDGQNFWPALQAGRVEKRNDMFFAVQGEVGPKQHALVDDGWKFVRIEADEKKPMAEYLFHLTEDPYEKKDLLASETARGTDMRSRMNKWIALHPPCEVIVTQTPHPGWVQPTDWSKAALS